MLIEVERKFKPDEEQMRRLLEGAEFESEEELSDVYYDFTDYDLHNDDARLRNRDGEFIKKVHVEKKLKNIPKNFDIAFEYNERDIQEQLGWSREEATGKSFLEMIKEKMSGNKLSELGQFKISRRIYKKDGIKILVDKTDYGYDIVELEKVLVSEVEIPEAIDLITKIAYQAGLKGQFEQKFPGKVKEYLRIKRPEIFQELYKNESKETTSGSRLEQIMRFGKMK